jgi:hypothetical protein
MRRMNEGQYQKHRRHPGRALKARPDIYEDTPMRIGRSRDVTGTTDLRHAFVLKDRQPVKVIGYSDGTDAGRNISPSSAQSTGTSQKNVLCVTDGMGPCIAVAVGGENIDATGTKRAGATVRIFHVYPYNDNAIADIRVYLDKLRSRGLTIKAAMHGGSADSETSMALAQNLRGLFQVNGIALQFDETCEKRGSYSDRTAVVQGASTPMGAVIKHDNSVNFITNIVGA